MLRDTSAATALRELDTIRSNVAPYGQVNRIEALIAAVESVNNKLAQEKREKALQLVDAKIAETVSALDAAHADADLRNRALKPLQDVKSQIASTSSIPKIFFLQERAGELLDETMEVIAAAVKSRTSPAVGKPVPGEKPIGEKAGVAPKPVKVIRPAELANKSYLETEDEVEEYLARLKKELLAAIKAGQRARIQ